MQWLGCLTGWWFDGGRVGWLGWKLRVKETRVQGQGGQKKNFFLEAMGIEPATRDMEFRLTTTSTVLTVLTWRVVWDLTGENGRIWKIGS